MWLRSIAGQMRRPVTSKTAGSNPAGVAINRTDGRSTRLNSPSIPDRNDEVRYINEYGPLQRGSTLIAVSFILKGVYYGRFLSTHTMSEMWGT